MNYIVKQISYVTLLHYTSQEILQTHLGLRKMVTILLTTFTNTITLLKCLHRDHHFTEVCFSWFNWQYVSTESGRRNTIALTIDDPVCQPFCGFTRPQWIKVLLCCVEVWVWQLRVGWGWWRGGLNIKMSSYPYRYSHYKDNDDRLIFTTEISLPGKTVFILRLGPVSISDKSTSPKKSRSREIGNSNYRIALKFDKHIGSIAADVPAKFQGDRTILNTNLAA